MSFGYNCSCSSARRVSNPIAKNLRGVHVHILFMPSGSIGVRRGDGDADNSNII